MERRLSWLWLPLAGLPLLLYGLVFETYAVNIPLFDDHALRHFLIKYQQAGSPARRLALIFGQHNEHRIAYDRLVVLIQYWFSREINFVSMMRVGNLALPAVAAVWYAQLRRDGFTGWQWLPLVVLLFSLSIHENTFWGMAALQNFTILCWVCLSLYALLRPGYGGLAAGIIFSVAGIYTSGNGFLLLPVAAGLLLWQGRYAHAGLYAALMAVAVAVYFYGYEKPPGNPHQLPLSEALLYGRGLLSFLGSGADRPVAGLPRLWPTWLLGSGLVAGFAGLAFFSFFRKNPPNLILPLYWLGLLAFTGLTALLVVWGRIGFGEEVLLTSRYKIYGLLALAGVYAGSLYFFRKKAFLISIVAFLGAAAYNAGQLFAHLPDIIRHRREMIAGQFSWTFSRHPPLLSPYNPATNPYHFPTFFYRPYLSLLTRPDAPTGPREGALTVENNQLIFNDNSTVWTSPHREAGAYLVLQDTAGTRLFPARMHFRRNVLYWQQQQFWGPGFGLAVLLEDLPDGRYAARLLRYDPPRVHLTALDTVTVRLPGRPPAVKTNW